MSIHFACEKCGHTFDVDEHLAGHRGRCKYCGHINAIPTAEGSAVGLSLRPLEDHAGDPDHAPHHHAVPLQVRPVAAEDIATTRGLDPDEPTDPHLPPRGWLGARKKVPSKGAPYSVLDPDGHEVVQSRAFHLNPHYETRLARFVLRTLKMVRDWLYVISLAFLSVAILGYALERKPLLYFGGTVVIACNIGMLVVSIFYLVTLPFKDSLPKGLGTVMIPPYAVMYWYNNWPQMRKHVINMLRSFTPILMVALGYFFYTETPTIVEKAGKVEEAMEKQGEALERLVVPDGSPKADPPPPADDPPPRSGKRVQPF